MDKVKGTGVLMLKKLIKDRGEAFEQEFMSRLDVESRQQWEITTWASSWVHAKLDGPGTLLYETALSLFPGDNNRALRELGKVIIRIPTPQFVFKRVAALWGRFYDTGDAGLENLNKSGATFVLRNYPEYPSYMREYMVGYLLGLGEILHLRGHTVKKVEDNPQAWQWILSWKV